MSKKQLQFAPLHEDPAVARPTTRDTNATLLSSRSRSVGFDRATVQGLLQDAGVADTGSRPASAILFGKVSSLLACCTFDAHCPTVCKG